MTTPSQFNLHLPETPANDILREKIKDLERQVIAAESRGDDAEVQRLYAERGRLRKMIGEGKT